MTLAYPLRIKQTLTATGDAMFTSHSGTAVSGFQLLSDAGISNGDYFRYSIEDGANYEIGNGYYGSTTIGRFPFKSSNSNNRINLSGNAVIFVTTTHFEVSPKQLLYEGTVSSGDTSISQNFYDLGYVGSFNYSKFEVEIDRLTPIESGTTYGSLIYLRVLNSSNNAVTSYIYEGQYFEATHTTEYGFRSTLSHVNLNRYHYMGGDTGESGWSGSIFFHHKHDLYGSDQYPIIRTMGGYINSSNDPTTHQTFVNFLDLSDIYGFYIYPNSSAGFESGGYKVYGIF